VNNLTIRHQPTPKAGVILLVDDSDLVRRFAKELLIEAAYHVLEAANASAALELTQSAEQRIDLLIADLLLPGPSGLDLARKLRATRPYLKVLLLSADPSNAPAAKLIPNASFLDKTKMVDHLTETVEEILAQGSHSDF
jgi:CheY-like chemotaxis protein